MQIKKNRNIWISDLTHTFQGIVSRVFPLGAGSIYSYSKQQLGNEFNFKLFKFPSDLNESLRETEPTMLCFSNFVWNFQISYKFAEIAKQRDPNVITVWGGPNFPVDISEKKEFFKKWPAIDFVVEMEGELGFVDLIKKLSVFNFNNKEMKKNSQKVINTCYIDEDNNFISGPINRIKDVNIIPSSYLNGAMDSFFEQPLIPIIETTRGCPFSCAFCADGLASKNVVHRFNVERIKEELYYIAKRTKNVNELQLADLNFGMYKKDIDTAKIIKDIYETYNYPTHFTVAGGKNLPERVMETASLIKGWTVGASIQSTDKDVLKAINRENISSDAYKKLIDFGNNQDSIKTYTDIILGLPGDTKQKHFESIRFSIDNHVNSIRMHQAMMLSGTEMASQTCRTKYGLKTKWRTSPGTVGYYEIIDKKYPIAEMDEIIIGSNTLSHKDYIDCRVMNLFVISFYNNTVFEEVFALFKSINIAPIDLIIYMKDHPEIHSNKIKKIIKEFIIETSEDLYDSLEETKKSVLSAEMTDKYIEGKLGYNELLANRERLFNIFDDLINLIFKSSKEIIKQNNLMTEEIENYLSELEKFVSIRKKDPLSDIGTVKTMKFNYDFKAISESKYRINPNFLKSERKPLNFDFFHNKEQQNYMSKQVKLYSANAEGMGRMLFNSDMRMFYRSFAKQT
jgi:radical SAM superfamily enzyme YgiQ (UPF0313 family)